MISVVTPSFRQMDWLRLAIASVADQGGVKIEHIVQDGGSEGIRRAFQAATQSVQHPHYEPRLFVEKDDGMYDAINRGLRRTGGEICCYLNCDEQYLPGALAQVAAAFERDSTLDVLLAGSIVVNAEGEYICSRPALKPSLRHLRAGKMYNLTSSIFFRAKLLRERALFFDSQLRIVGDREWFQRVVESGARIEVLAMMTSVFFDLGTNLGLHAEDGDADSQASWWQRASANAAVTSHRVARLLAGHYRLRPFGYSIYTISQPDRRQTFEVLKPTGVWHNRL